MKSTVRYAVIIVLAMLALGQSGCGVVTGPYKDYLVRSQVAEGAVLAKGPEIALAEFYSDNQRWPTNNQEAGLSPPASIAGKYVSSVDVGVRPGTIVVTYGRQAAAAPIRGEVLALSASTLSGTTDWNCDTSMTTIPAKYLPASCGK